MYMLIHVLYYGSLKGALTARSIEVYICNNMLTIWRRFNVTTNLMHHFIRTHLNFDLPNTYIMSTHYIEV